MERKIISIVLCLALLLSLAPAAFAEQSDFETVTGEYSYCPSLGFLDFVTNQTGAFSFSDEYFTHSGYDYDHQLAVMTMVMNLTCFAGADSSIKGWDTANSNFNDLLEKCGFSEFDANEDAVTHPGRETIGAYAASKPLTVDGKTYTLIAFGVRGHNYGGEWYGNFNMGYTGDHAGFAKARDKALSFMREYVDEHDITGPVKIWLTGYSRGAITANMVGGELDKGFDLGAAELAPEDLYCYTFETPQGAADENCRDELFCNIHNILNYNDFVPHVSPAAFGHSRYGIDYYLPCRQYDSSYAGLKKTVDARLENMGWMNILGITLDTVDSFRYLSLDPLTAIAKRDVTQIGFFPEVLDALTSSLAPSRAYYVENLEEDLKELTGTLLGVDFSRLLNALGIFGQKFVSIENLSGLIGKLSVKGISAVGDLTDMTVDLFMEAMQEAQCANYNGDQVRAMLDNLVPKLLVLVKENPDTMLTLLGNLLPVINAHFPELNLEWLRVTPEEFFEAQNTHPGNVRPAFFEDVAPGSYYFSAVKWASEAGIALGFSPERFGPDELCSRAQAVTFLWRAAGCPEPESDVCPFADVSADSVYYNAILWAWENGVTVGADSTHFDPDGSCTRAQIVTFLYRFAGSPSVRVRCPFIDVSLRSPYYSAIAWAYSKGIALGTDALRFSPDDFCTRSHIVTFLYRYMA